MFITFRKRRELPDVIFLNGPKTKDKTPKDWTKKPMAHSGPESDQFVWKLFFGQKSKKIIFY